MSFTYNGTALSKITYNGTALSKITYNGTEIWENSQGFQLDSNTLALLHFDSGVTTDTAGKYTWATRGTPTLNTSNKKFGAASLDTSRNGGIAASNGSAFSFPSGTAFTMEGWFYLFSNYGQMSLFGKHNSGHNLTYLIAILSNYNGHISVYDGSAIVVAQSSVSVPTEKWVHIAVARGTSGNAKIFLDGVSVCETNVSFSGGQPFGVGIAGAGSLDAGKGLIDEVRISDVCRYTSNFTP